MCENFRSNSFMQEFLTALEEALNLDEGALSPETVLADLKEWDSLGVVEFQSLVDEELDLQVPPPQITACDKVQGLIDLVAEKLEG